MEYTSDTKNKNLPHESKLADTTKILKNYVYVKKEIQHVVTIYFVL